MEDTKMVVSAYFSGNSSFGTILNFEFPLSMFDGDDDDTLRDEIRDRFQDMVQALMGVRPITVWFVDECAYCIQRLEEDNFCHNKSCSYYLEE